MSWREIIRQLYALYAIDDHASLFPDEAIRLNERLLKAIGKNYCDLPASLIESCVFST